jgi:hypothetical protein
MTIWCCLAGGMFARADAPGPIPVERLIDQLGDRDFRVRQEASKAILARGSAVLETLRKHRANSDAEVRERLDHTISQLERQVALGAHPVTLHLVQKPVAEALTQLAKQTGYNIPLDGQVGTIAKQTIGTFDFDKLLFWEALDRVCEPAGLTLQQNEGENTLRLAAQNSYVPFRSYADIFKVTATGFQYSINSWFQQVTRGTVPSATSYESLQLNLTVAVEPRLAIMKMGQVQLSAAEDEEGRSMLIKGNPNGYYPAQMRFYNGGMQRSYFQSTSVQLALPARTSRSVKSLKGIVPVTLLVEKKPLVVTDQILAAKGKTFKAGSATFHVEEVTNAAPARARGPQRNSQTKIRIGFEDDTIGNGWDYSQLQMVPQRLEVQDAKGKKLTAQIMIQMFRSPTSGVFQINLLPQTNKDLGPPARLIFQHWVQMDHEVAFHFKSLPLP